MQASYPFARMMIKALHYSLKTRRSLLTQALTVFITLGLLMGCAGRERKRPETQQTSSSVWQYPIQLGDSKTRVHELLGAASRVTPELEEYPLSGVSAWFDGEGRVTKLWFAGEACTVYSGYDDIQHNPLPTDRQILFGVTPYTNERGFRQALGVPPRENQEGRAAVRELRCIWRSQGYLVDALFLVAERSQGDKTFAKGSLVWFEVSRAI